VRVRVYDAADAGDMAASPLFRGTLPPANKMKVVANAAIAGDIEISCYVRKLHKSGWRS
jgi:hypothetical protein